MPSPSISFSIFLRSFPGLFFRRYSAQTNKLGVYFDSPASAEKKISLLCPGIMLGLFIRHGFGTSPFFITR